MEGNKHIYTATDFARYHAGTMPPGEMFALEKAALEDPFLSDALDGYVFSPDAEKELNDIQMRLDEKTKRKNVAKVFSLSSGVWWRIAAMFIVIAGVGYFFYQAGNTSMSNTIAQQEKQKIEERETLTARAKNDTAAIDNNLALQKRPVIAEPGAVTSPGNSALENNNSKILPAPKKQTEVEPVAISPSGPPAFADKASIEIQKQQSLESKKMNDQNAAAKMKAESLSKNLAKVIPQQVRVHENTDTTAEAKGYFLNNDNDKKDSLNSVALNRVKPSLDEVVIVGMGSKRKVSRSNNLPGELRGKVSGISIGQSQAYLLDGKEKFDQYIKANVNLASLPESMNDSVKILLSFSLNRNIKPAKIKVLESNCKPCEEEAIRLLKNGPKWVGARGSKGTVQMVW